MTKPTIQFSQLLPAKIRTQLAGLSWKSRITAAEHGSDSRAHRAVISEIDVVREQARSMRPDLFRYVGGDPMDPAPTK